MEEARGLSAAVDGSRGGCYRRMTAACWGAGCERLRRPRAVWASDERRPTHTSGSERELPALQWAQTRSARTGGCRTMQGGYSSKWCCSDNVPPGGPVYTAKGANQCSRASRKRGPHRHSGRALPTRLRDDGQCRLLEKNTSINRRQYRREVCRALGELQGSLAHGPQG